MRKKTEPRSQKQTASSSNHSGLIVGTATSPQSAGPKPALDNRSHRTFQRCRTSPLLVQVQPVVRSARPPHRNNITLSEGGVPGGGAASRRGACASKRRDSTRRARRGRRAKRGALAHALLSERRRVHASPGSTRSPYTRAGDASLFLLPAPQEKSAHIEARRRIVPTTPNTSEMPGSEPAPRCSTANLPRAWNR
jgi:hypothetical protein